MRSCCLLLSLLCCLLDAADAPVALTVRAQMPWANQEAYTPVLVFIESNKDQDILLEASTYNNDSSVSRTVSVKAGQRHRETLLLPSSGIRISNATLKWRSNSGNTGETHCSATTNYRHTLFAVCDRDNSLDGNEFLNQLPDSRHSSSGQRYIDIQSTSIPDYWQGIPLWLGLLLTPTAERNLTTAQQQALAQWQRAGGHLFVTTRQQQTVWGNRGCHATLANNSLEHNPVRSALNGINSEINATIRQYQVPGTDEVPVAAFVMILFLFITVVGPLNYWWVRRNQQLHLFLITTPIISGIFCLVLGLFGLLSDGLSAHRSVIELTRIDHQHKQACTWTNVSWFSGLSPGAIAVSNDSEVRLIDRDVYDRHRYYNDAAKQFEASWANQQMLNGDWLLSRTHQQIQYTRPHTEERRLLLHQEDGTYFIENGFDQELLFLTWQDASERVWECQQVQSGQRAQLTLRRKQKRINAENPAYHVNRFAPNVQHIWNQHEKQPLHFTAAFAAPLYPVPGPEAEDNEDPRVLLCGLLLVEGQP